MTKYLDQLNESQKAAVLHKEGPMIIIAGAGSGKTEGQMLNPMMASPTNPYGAVPGTNVGYEMTTDMIMVGISYKLGK